MPVEDFNDGLLDDSFVFISFSCFIVERFWFSIDLSCSLDDSIWSIESVSLVGLVDVGDETDEFKRLAGAKTETGTVRRWPWGERRRFEDLKSQTKKHFSNYFVRFLTCTNLFLRHSM